MLGLLLLFDCDFTSFIPMIFLWFGGYQTNTWVIPSPEFIIVMIQFGIDLLFIYRIIKNYNIYWERIKKDYLLYSLAAILASMALSLINTPDLGLSGLGISHFVIILLSYLLVKTTVVPNDKNRDYIIKSILITGLMIAIQSLYVILSTLASGVEPYEFLYDKEMHLGWIHPNHYAAILNICCILAIYYFCKHPECILQRIFATFCGLIFFFFNLMTVSRGRWVTFAVTIILSFTVYFIYNLNIKKREIIKDL